MPTTDTDRLLETLEDPECRPFLGAARIGRLGFTSGALPAIQPVFFRVHGDDVVIPVRPETGVLPRRGGTIVVFQVDAYDETERTGWSVSVVGPVRLVTDPAGVAAYDVLPWPRPVTAPDRCYLAVGMVQVRGWRTVPLGAAELEVVTS